MIYIIKNIYILDNELFNTEDFCISGFSPRYETYYEKYKEYWCEYFIEDFLKSDFKFNKNKYNILLCHSPRIIYKDEVIKNSEIKKVLENIDLILSGHLHDGSIPRFIQNIGLVKSDKGFIITGSVTIGDKCRGIHPVLNAQMIVTRGIRKWSNPNIFFKQIDKICAKDISTIKLSRKI